MEKIVISLIGLGYVGMPIAVAFARTNKVIGFDINKTKVEQYRNGIDATKEVGDNEVKNSGVYFTSNIDDVKKANFHIVAVPTPLKENNTPDLAPLEGASKLLGKVLKKGDYVVYESTVFPGVTEDVCVPILEEVSGLKLGIDFKVGYSPERINPGDKVHRLENIVKIVSGSDQEALNLIAKVYEIVVEVGVHRAPSIKVAEAAKVIENAQRDINIAFMNELSSIFNLMDINTNEVLEAAGTKWNFLKFSPGLVGGHCIGIDPYYLTHKAQEVGYYPEIILSGRKTNDRMGRYIADSVVKKIVKAKVNLSKTKIAILGLTFKEDTPDIRNTRVIDIVEELEKYNIEVVICDPMADPSEVKSYYNLDLCDMKDIKDVSAVIVAVSHKEFIDLTTDDFTSMFMQDMNILVDVKGIHRNIAHNFDYWSL